MKKLFISLIVFSLFLLAGSASAYTASSPNYQLEKDSLNVGGADFSSSPNYFLSDTVGEIVSGLTNGANNNASSGYRFLELDPLSPPAPILGCTDVKATNYKQQATRDDGSCVYNNDSGGRTIEVSGCLDAKALNYNPSATIDDGSCVYENKTPPILGCADPEAINYNARATKDDGSCRYSPPSEVTPPSPIVPAPIINFGNEAGGGGSSGLVLNFLNNLLLSGSTSAKQVVTTPTKDWQVRFVQVEEPVKTFDYRLRVNIVGAKRLTVIFNYNLATSTLKTVVATLSDSAKPEKTTSFLLRPNKDGRTYEATIAPLLQDGTYLLDIYLVGVDNHLIKHIRGKVIVPSVAVLVAQAIEQAAPVVATTGLAVGFLPSLYDLLAIALRALASLFARRKKEEPWGTVYDAVTKQPLDPVYLTVTDARTNKEITTAITDIDGRFNFFLPAGEYYLKANKTHYLFPSEKMQGKLNDELYDHLYFGQKFATTGEAVANLNIPMDPLDFDWNEFAKTKTNFFRFYARRQIWLNRFYNLIFGLGFLLSLYAHPKFCVPFSGNSSN